MSISHFYEERQGQAIRREFCTAIFCRRTCSATFQAKELFPLSIGECARIGDPGYDLAIVTRGSRKPLKEYREVRNVRSQADWLELLALRMIAALSAHALFGVHPPGVMNRGPGRERQELGTTLKLSCMLMLKFRRWLVSALKRVRSESFRLRVVPFEGAWKVAFDRDSSNMFSAKAETIKCARNLARIHGLTQIAVCDDHERVTAVIRVQPFYLP